MTTLYGIKNCDTVRKARRWLDDNDISHDFHDVRSDGLDSKRLAAWERQLGWEQLLNRRGTTWRRLPEAEREGIDRSRALQLMLRHPAIIKRPVLDTGGALHIGFDAHDWRAIFG